MKIKEVDGKNNSFEEILSARLYPEYSNFQYFFQLSLFNYTNYINR